MILIQNKPSIFLMGDAISYAKFQNLRIPYSNRGRQLFIFASKVDHYEAYGNNTFAFMENNGGKILLDTTISATALWLPGNHCDRFHRFTIGNLNHLAEFHDGKKPYYNTSDHYRMYISRNEKGRIKDVIRRYSPMKGVRK